MLLLDGLLHNASNDIDKTLTIPLSHSRAGPGLLHLPDLWHRAPADRMGLRQGEAPPVVTEEGQHEQGARRRRNELKRHFWV